MFIQNIASVKMVCYTSIMVTLNIHKIMLNATCSTETRLTLNIDKIPRNLSGPHFSVQYRYHASEGVSGSRLTSESCPVREKTCFTLDSDVRWHTVWLRTQKYKGIEWVKTQKREYNTPWHELSWVHVSSLPLSVLNSTHVKECCTQTQLIVIRGPPAPV